MTRKDTKARPAARHRCPSQKAMLRKPLSEHRLQCDCVLWFRLSYPKLRHLLFAVPNGGRRDAITGARLKEEGATPGVSDLILLKASRTSNALCIEMKAPGGRQSAAQKQWQEEVEKHGPRYAVCRSLQEFQNVLNEYLNNEYLNIV